MVLGERHERWGGEAGYGFRIRRNYLLSVLCGLDSICRFWKGGDGGMKLDLGHSV
jgi:hypothetical protein